MPRPAANPYDLGEPVRATLNARDTEILDYVDEVGDDLDGRVDALETAAGDVMFGNETIGATPSLIGSNSKMVNRFTVTADGEIPWVEVYLDGNGGTVGSQAFKGILYADDGSNPTAKLGESTQVNVTSGAAAAFVRFTFPAPIPVTLGDVISMGWFSGTSGGVGRYYYDGGGAQRYNADTFTDGAADPFGAATPVGQILTVRALIQNNTATRLDAVDADIVALQAVDTSLDSRIDTLEGASGSGGGGAEVTTYALANYPIPAGAVVESDPMTGDGVTVIPGAAGDQTIASLVTLDSLDAVTYRTHATAASVVTRPLWKVRCTNGGTAQGDFELNVSVL